MKRLPRWIPVVAVALILWAAIWPEQVNGLLWSGAATLAIAVGIAIVFLAIVMAVVAPLLRATRRNTRLRRQLMETGKVMSATVLRVVDTGITSGNDPFVEITVRTIGDAEATFKTTVSRVSFPRVGETMHVRYDPADPTVAVPF